MTSSSDGPPHPVDAVPPDSSRQISIHGNRLNSGDLFQTARELIIAHGEETYRLRLTSQNKLILTK
ncbi:MAG: hemin uptake protein HemP [Xanthobacteraceae bacterium]|nr:hemin uptake protein HemP [Xanthobacteraceae bacterium]